MNSYQYKGKVTCLNRADGMVVVSWTKEVTITAATEAQAWAELERRMRDEYEDVGIRIEIDMKLAGSELSAAPPPPAPAATPTISTPPPSATDDGAFRFRI